MPTLQSKDGRCVLDEKTHRYTIDGKPALGVTEILQDNGLVPKYCQEESYRVRGKYVHAACHFLDEGDLDWATVHPQIIPYIKAWEACKSEYGISVLSCEELVYSPVYRVCGTLDRRVMIQVWKAGGILDIKTSERPGVMPPPQTAYQTGGYAGMAGIHKDSVRCAVTLWPDGKHSGLVPFNSPSDWTDFLALAQATRIRRRHNKHGIEPKADD